MAAARQLVALALLALLPSSCEAKGGGRASGSLGSGGGGGSGRMTAAGAAVPMGCRSCYSGSSGMFYNRIFLYSYMGHSMRCYSCGSRSDYALEQEDITLQAVTGSVTIQHTGSGTPTAAEYTADFAARLASGW